MVPFPFCTPLGYIPSSQGKVVAPLALSTVPSLACGMCSAVVTESKRRTACTNKQQLTSGVITRLQLAYMWLTNDEYGVELLNKAKREPGEACDQAQWLCDQYEESLYAVLNYDNAFGEASLFRDLIETAFEEINWTEIVRHG